MSTSYMTTLVIKAEVVIATVVSIQPYIRAPEQSQKVKHLSTLAVLGSRPSILRRIWVKSLASSFL